MIHYLVSFSGRAIVAADSQEKALEKFCLLSYPGVFQWHSGKSIVDLADTADFFEAMRLFDERRNK